MLNECLRYIEQSIHYEGLNETILALDHIKVREVGVLEVKLLQHLVTQDQLIGGVDRNVGPRVKKQAFSLLKCHSIKLASS